MEPMYTNELRKFSELQEAVLLIDCLSVEMYMHEEFTHGSALASAASSERNQGRSVIYMHQIFLPLWGNLFPT